jgi:hypothetical protein
LYDRFYAVLYDRQQRAEIMQEEAARKAKASRLRATEIVTGLAGQSAEKGRVALGPSPTQMDYEGFREFLAGKMVRFRLELFLANICFRNCKMGHHRFSELTTRRRNAQVTAFVLWW